jgi:hypothetical protein
LEALNRLRWVRNLNNWLPHFWTPLQKQLEQPQRNSGTAKKSPYMNGTTTLRGICILGSLLRNWFRETISFFLCIASETQYY